ncbi:MAG: hypothetical protein IPH88_04560 [Bacteroidales bacterium]|nr:hypothetical protein [Bacteroidales bacterium]
MKRIKLLLFLIACLTISAFATHQRAGEITFRYISGLTYEITIISYSYAPSPADRCQLEINWGDGTTSVLTSSNGRFGVKFQPVLCDTWVKSLDPTLRRTCIQGNTLTLALLPTKFLLKTPTEIMGSMNIPSSVDIPLLCRNSAYHQSFHGPDNSSIAFTSIDQGCIDIHSFITRAYDLMATVLLCSSVCRGAGGGAIPGYILPKLVDPNSTGTLRSILSLAILSGIVLLFRVNTISHS